MAEDITKEENIAGKELTEEERLKNRQKYGAKGRTAKNDPACAENEAEFSGKIIGIYRQKITDGTVTKFIISCGHIGMKRDDNGRYIRDHITIRFFDDEGTWYAARFKEGDFVIARAVVQTHTNIHTWQKTTEFWGQSMVDARNNVLQNDYNKVHLTGRVVKAEKSDGRWLSVVVHTSLWKTRFNIRTERNDCEDLYISDTRVGVYCSFDDPDHIVNYRLTKGTIVSIDGRVFGRPKKRKDGKGTVWVESVTAENIRVIGKIQEPQKDPVTKVEHQPGDEGTTANVYSTADEVEEA